MVKVQTGGVLDVSGCNWLIDVSTATLSAQRLLLKVVNEKLRGKKM